MALKPLGLGDNAKFWVEITRLKNRISESLELARDMWFTDSVMRNSRNVVSR